MSLPNQQYLQDLIDLSPWLLQDRDLVAHIKNNNNRTSTIFNEVSKLIDELNLLEYAVGSVTPQEQVTRTTSETRSERPKRSLLSETKKTSSMSVLRQEVPVLTMKERRLSFELMHPKPIREGLRTHALTNAPHIAVSNVSVSTRVTDIERNGYAPVKEAKFKNAFKDRFKSYQNKMRLGKVAAVEGDSKLDSSTLRNSPTPSDGNHKLRPTNISNGDLKIKALRRSSFVGENLPAYIRAQLQQPEANDPVEAETSQIQTSPQVGNDSFTQHETNLSEPSSKTGESSKYFKKSTESGQDQRISNLLANSLVMYSRNQESLSSGYDHGHNGSTVSEADREYILPSLFARSVEDFNDNEMLYEDSNPEEDEEEEDVDDFLFTK